jgi:hypothetical protein
MSIEHLLPIDKSHAIRCLCLDLLNNRFNFVKLLRNKRLPDDIKHAVKAIDEWHTKKEVYVGESATLLRFLRYIAWTQKRDKKFILDGTLKSRKISDNGDIIYLHTKELLKLDSGTSQWASIAYICGRRDKLPTTIPFKLQLTIDICKEYNNGKFIVPIIDETIAAQTRVFIDILKGVKSTWKPTQAEDYCFGRVFGFITEEEGNKKWPQLVNHESNRLKEVEDGLQLLSESNSIISSDHRVVQALVMVAIKNGIKYRCKNRSCVSKSWPQFWEFINETTQTKI